MIGLEMELSKLIRDQSIFTGGLVQVHFKFSVQKKSMSYRLLHQSQRPNKYWPVPKWGSTVKLVLKGNLWIKS